MTLQELQALPRAVNYADMVRGLFTKELGGIAGQRMHATIGISGECAELIPAHLLDDKKNLFEEAGDAYFYFQALLNMTGYDLAELLSMGATFDPELYDYDLYMVNYAAGELLDLAKKCWVYGKEYHADSFKQAMANWILAFEGFITLHEITIEDCMAHNQNKLVTGKNARYAGGAYSDAAAIARADKVGEERSLEHTSSDHVWRDKNGGKFFYSDEAEQIVETPYNTEAEAAEALGNYVQSLNLR